MCKELFRFFTIFLMIFMLFSCYKQSTISEKPINSEKSKNETKAKIIEEPKVVLKEIQGLPSNTWIGKTLSISFGAKWPKTLANLSIVVKLMNVETDEEGVELFKTDKVYSSKGHDYLYFSWFDISSTPHLQSWKEILQP